MTEITLPLSYGQRALWFMHQLAPESAAYNTIIAVRITAELDARALQSALQAGTVDRHAAFRTTFGERDGVPFQHVQPACVLPFERVDAHTWTDEDVHQRVAACARQPFDLANGPLLRCTLFTRGPENHVLLIATHHIVADAWSLAILLSEVPARYVASPDAHAADLVQSSATYAEYVDWQAELLNGTGGASHREYWHRQLSGELPQLTLTSDRPRAARRQFVGGTLSFSIDAELRAGLKRLARQEQATLYTVLLGAFYVLLHRYSGQEDLLVGSPMAGRTDARFRRIVGYFVSPVVLRASLAGDASFRAFLEQVQATVRDAQIHQDYPLALLVEDLQPVRDPARSPLFDVMFNFLPSARLAPSGSDHGAAERLPMSPYAAPQQEGQFDLVLEVTGERRTLEAEVRYSSELFDRPTIQHLADDYRTLLAGIVANPDASLSELEPVVLHKRDACALPASEPQTRDDGAASSLPATHVEDVLRAIYANVLALEHVEVNQSFFVLGGHSLQATQVIARIRTALRVEVPLRTMFEAPAVRELAVVVEQQLRAAAGLPLPRLAATRRDHPLRLSYSQERMWLVQALQPDSSAYNMVAGLRLRGTLRVDVLERSIGVLVERHESLRTSIELTSSGPVQVIAPMVKLELPCVDLSELRDDDAEAALRQRASRLAAQPFDLQRGPLARLVLFRLDPQQHVLMLTLHHVICDAWSLGIIVRELAEVYCALLEERAPTLPELAIHYADFAHWQRGWFQGEILQQQLAYWRAQLAGVSLLELPSDRPRPAVQTYRGATAMFAFPGGLFDGVRAWCLRDSATPFMACLAAFATVLQRYTAQTDITVGMPIANRRWLQSEHLVGTLVNTLALRIDFSTDPSAGELLHQVREVALDAYTHQDMPFEALVAELQPKRNASHSPLFQVMFDYINTPIGDLSLPGLTLALEHVDRLGAQVDLTLIVVDTPQVQQVSVEFNTDLFDGTTIERLVDQFWTVLAAMIATPELASSRLPLLPPGERQQLLVEWNATATDYPRDDCIHDLVTAQAQRTPHATAIIAGDERLTYQEVESRSNQLAHYLRELGIRPGDVVAVSLERSELVPLALLGILKTGAAYVPVDPHYPAERRRFMLADSQATLLVTQQTVLSALSTRDAPRVVCLDAPASRATIEAGPTLPVDAGVTGDDLAYIIYTSGSSGLPKGVQIGHRGVVNFLHAMGQRPGLSPTDTLVAVTTLSFDIAVLELFLPLVSGARLVVASREAAMDGERLTEVLSSSRATFLQATPVTWRLLLNAGWTPPPGFTAVCGGERLPSDLAEALLAKDVELWNAYGPTETTVWSTIHRVNKVEDVIPVGHPIANTRVYVLDVHDQPVPVGAQGELCIGGDGVAHGYLNRAELTDVRFIADPFAVTPSARLYRTGDVARFLPDGTLQVLGRLDQQFKLHGHRIEPGEIECVLRQHAFVREACVTLQHDAAGEPRLVAYTTSSANDSAAEPSELRGLLRARLPEFMVPAVFVALGAFPLTPNGKLDRAALPPVQDQDADAGALSGYIAPRDAIEAALAEEWEALLGHAPIGVLDNFFDLGGNSLAAVRLMSRIQGRFGCQVPVATLLRSATVAELAEVLRSPAGVRQSRSLVEIQPGRGAAPMFFVHGLFGDVLCFADVARALGSHQLVYGLQARGLDGLEPPMQTVEEMASAYIEEIRSVQPHGPYRLAGWSSGGSTAYEMACQLEAAGEVVDLLGVFDHPPAGDHMASSTPVQKLTLLRRFAAHLWCNMPYWLGILRHAGQGGAMQLLRERVRIMVRTFGRELSGQAPSPQAIVRDIEATNGLEYVQDWPASRRHVLEVQFEAMRTYRPGPYVGSMLLFRCQRQPLLSAHDPLLGWGRLVRGGVEVVRVHGSHRGLLKGAGARFLGATLGARLASLSPNHSKATAGSRPQAADHEV